MERGEVKIKIILTFLLLIFCYNISWAEDLKDKDNVYYTAYKMASDRCYFESSGLRSKVDCVDRKVLEYIKMLREAK